MVNRLSTNDDVDSADGVVVADTAGVAAVVIITVVDVDAVDVDVDAVDVDATPSNDVTAENI